MFNPTPNPAPTAPCACGTGNCARCLNQASPVLDLLSKQAAGIQCNLWSHGIGPIVYDAASFPQMKQFQRMPFDCDVSGLATMFEEGEHRCVPSDGSGDLSQTATIAAGTATITVGGAGQPTANFPAFQVRVAFNNNASVSPITLAVLGVSAEPGNPAYEPLTINFTPGDNTCMYTFLYFGFVNVGDLTYPSFIQTSTTSTLVATFTGPNGAAVTIDPIIAPHEDYRTIVANLRSLGNAAAAAG